MKSPMKYALSGMAVVGALCLLVAGTIQGYQNGGVEGGLAVLGLGLLMLAALLAVFGIAYA